MSLNNLKSILEACDDCRYGWKRRSSKEKNNAKLYDCLEISTILDQISQQLDDNVAQKFFESITNRACYTDNSEDLAPITIQLAEQYMPNEDCLALMIRSSVYDECFKNVVITDKIIKNFAKFRLKYEGDDLRKIIDIIIDRMEINITNIAILCRCNNAYLFSKLAIIIDEFDYVFKINLLYRAYQYYPESRDFVIALEGKGLQFDDYCLEIVCKYCPFDALADVLCKYRITPTSKHFNSIFKLEKPTYHSINNDKVKKKINVLLEHGYQLSRSDVITTIKYGINLPCLDRLGIMFDKEMLDICAQNSFFPDLAYVVEPKIELLKALCKSYVHSSIIEDVVEKYNLVPDEDCMVYVCSKYNMPMVKFLISKGGWITPRCMEYILKGVNQNLIDLMVSDNIRYTSMLENRIKELGGTIPNIYNKPIICIDVSANEVVQVKKCKKGLMPKKFTQINNNIRGNNKSFRFVKTNLVKRIRENYWLAKGNDQLIDLPRYIRDILGLGDGYINFKDIDKLVCLFYRNDNDQNDDNSLEEIDDENSDSD